MILLIDNYDSFTYNLVQRLGELDPTIDLQVFRNDQITAERIEELRPSHIIVWPGACTPREAGVSNQVIERFAPRCRSSASAWGTNASVKSLGERCHVTTASCTARPPGSITTAREFSGGYPIPSRQHATTAW